MRPRAQYLLNEFLTQDTREPKRGRTKKPFGVKPFGVTKPFGVRSGQDRWPRIDAQAPNWSNLGKVEEIVDWARLEVHPTPPQFPYLECVATYAGH